MSARSIARADCPGSGGRRSPTDHQPRVRGSQLKRVERAIQTSFRRLPPGGAHCLRCRRRLFAGGTTGLKLASVYSEMAFEQLKRNGVLNDGDCDRTGPARGRVGCLHETGKQIEPDIARWSRPGHSLTEFGLVAQSRRRSSQSERADGHRRLRKTRDPKAVTTSEPETRR